MAKILITPQAVAQLIIVIPQSEADCGDRIFIFIQQRRSSPRDHNTRQSRIFVLHKSARMIIQTKITKTSLQIVSFNR